MHKSEISPFAFLLLPWFDTFMARFQDLKLEINQLKQ